MSDPNTHKQRRFLRFLDGLITMLVGTCFIVGRWCAGLFERAEWIFGHVASTTLQLGTLLYRLFIHGPLAVLQIVAFPFVVCFVVSQRFFIDILERNEWIVGHAVFVGGEVGRILLQIVFWIPCRLMDSFLGWISRGPVGVAFRWLVRKTIPAYVLRAIPYVESVADIFLFVWFAILNLIASWSTTRDSWKLLYSAPALVLALPLISTLLIAQSDSVSDKTTRYRNVLEQALLDEDDVKVELCLARLDQLGYRRQERELFRVAFAKAEAEGVDKAYGRMLMLADGEDGEEDGGFSPAKLWLASHLLVGDLSSRTKSPIDDAKALVLDVVAREGASVETSLLLSEIEVKRNAVGRGIAELESMSKKNSFEVHGRLMQLHSANGDRVAAETAARKAANAFGFQPRSQPNSFARQMLYAESVAMGNDWKALRDALSEATRQFPDEQSEIAVARLIELGAPMDIEMAMLLYRIGQSDEGLNHFLAKQLVQNASGLRAFVDDQKAIGRVSPLLFRMAGDEEFLVERRSTALEYYLEATELNPADATAWNNVAWLQLQFGRFEDALLAAERAVASAESPNFLETRGQILAKLQRWRESIDDLERALNGRLADSSAAHRTLAIAYQSLGQTDLALAHRNLE